MNKKKRILVASFFAVMMLIISFPQLGGHVQQQVFNGETEADTGGGSIEIIDISFEGLLFKANPLHVDVSSLFEGTQSGRPTFSVDLEMKLDGKTIRGRKFH